MRLGFAVMSLAVNGAIGANGVLEVCGKSVHDFLCHSYENSWRRADEVS